MTEEKIADVLGSVGLHKNEIKIYLDLVKYSKSSALDISKRTKMHRSNTYDAVRKLIDKGFVSEVIEEKKRLFIALEPEKIKDYLNHKQRDIDEIIGQLKVFSKADNAQEEVTVSKGTFAVREALRDLLKQGKEINVYGASISSVNLFGLGFLKEFHNERIKNKIMMRHIYDKGAVDRVKLLNKMKFTEAKCLSDKYYSIVSTNVAGDTVLLIAFSNPVSCIKMKSKDLADSYTKYFELLWKQAKNI